MTNWNDDDLVMVSAIEHYSYCPRQCALIHVEKVFDENIFTLRGTMMHDRVDAPSTEREGDVLIERALPIWSERYGLIGKADLIEFHPDGQIVPVEYKIDTRRSIRHDDLQLCAEAICLEEMMGRPVLFGAVYSGSAKRRREVIFTDDLRRNTIRMAEEIRSMIERMAIPKPVNDARCSNCSLIEACLPHSAVSTIGMSAFHPSDCEGPE